MQQIWVQQLLVLIAGAVLLWFMRLQRLKSTNEERRRDNWSTVPTIACAIASVIIWIDERSGIKASHIVYGVIILAAYAGFVYRWNLVGVDDD